LKLLRLFGGLAFDLAIFRLSSQVFRRNCAINRALELLDSRRKYFSGNLGRQRVEILAQR
jgi:hypothetical protein